MVPGAPAPSKNHFAIWYWYQHRPTKNWPAKGREPAGPSRFCSCLACSRGGEMRWTFVQVQFCCWVPTAKKRYQTCGAICRVCGSKSTSQNVVGRFDFCAGGDWGTPLDSRGLQLRKRRFGDLLQSAPVRRYPGFYGGPWGPFPLFYFLLANRAS